MANPLRIVASMPKRPFELVCQKRAERDALAVRNELVAAGYCAKVTKQRVGSSKARQYAFNVWKRERANQNATRD